MRRTVGIDADVGDLSGRATPVRWSPAVAWLDTDRIAALVRAPTCRVLSETHVQIAWYSGCPSVRSGDHESTDEPTIAAVRPEDAGDIRQQTAGWCTLAITPGYVIVANDAFVARLR